jgi:hypothetical protein
VKYRVWQRRNGGPWQVIGPAETMDKAKARAEREYKKALAKGVSIALDIRPA